MRTKVQASKEEEKEKLPGVSRETEEIVKSQAEREKRGALDMIPDKYKGGKK